jgi:hypothetical protein
MFHKCLSVALAVLLGGMFSVRCVRAHGVAGEEARDAARVKASVAKLGVGEKARVEVKLLDKTKLKGYVSEAGTETFTVVSAKDGAAVVVPYANVGQLKGHNLTTGTKIALTVAVVAGFILLAVALIKGGQGD